MNDAREVGIRSPSQKCQWSSSERSSSLHCGELRDGDLGAEDTAGVSQDPKTSLSPQVPWAFRRVSSQQRFGCNNSPGALEPPRSENDGAEKGEEQGEISFIRKLALKFC